MWERSHNRDNPKLQEIIPVNDIKEHEKFLDGAIACPCNPVIEDLVNGGKMIIHNAFDAREY